MKNIKIPFNISLEEASEFKKSYIDIIYFVDTYVYFNDKEKGFVKMNLFPYQADLLRQLKSAWLTKDPEKMKYVVNKSRQLGISWIVAIFILWVFIYGEDQRMLIGSKKLADAKEILKRIRDMYSFLPSFFKYFSFGEDTQVKWENAKRRNIISAEATTEGIGRSLTPNLVFLDEMAHMPEGVDEWSLWSSLLPAIENGMFIGVSTPNGLGNLFHYFWTNHKEAGSVRIPIHWSARPDRCQTPELFAELEKRRRKGLLPTPEQIELLKQEQWYINLRKQINEDKWQQEYEMSFLNSGRPVFGPEDINKQEKNLLPPLRTEGEVFIWEEPLKNVKYIGCFDPSRGIGQDNHAFTIFKRDTGEQVLEFANNKPSNDFIRKVIELLTRYNKAFLIFENNIQADLIMELMTEAGYYNIYYSLNTGRPGWETTGKSKSIMISNLSDSLFNEELVLRSEDLLEELRTYVHTDKGTMEAYTGCKDDRVMASALYLQALKIWGSVKQGVKEE